MQYIPVNTFGLILIIIRKTPRRRVPVSLCDGYCQRLTKKKSGLTHWPCSHVVCSAFFQFTSHFSSLSQTLVFSQGVELHAKKTKKLHHCVSNLYGFLWFSVMFIILHLCIYRHDMSFWPVLSKARSSPQSRELCCHAARGSLIISTRACSESPQDSAGSEGLWLGAICSIEHRELQAALENDGKKTRTP